MSSGKKRILLTGGRFYVTLDLARQFKAQGYEIYAAETSDRHVCRFSNAVTKSFVVPSPRFESKKFIDSLIEIINEYNIDLLIPTFEETYYISEAIDRFPKKCQVFCMPFDKIKPLHNKWEFMETLKRFGFKTPETYLLQSQEDLQKVPLKQPYALKACYSRAGLSIYKVIPPNSPPKIKIDPYNPWIAQEWIKGKSFCSYSVCWNGEVKALSIYPVEYTVGGMGCLTFRTVYHSGIEAWIKKLVKDLNFTGQISFDFIEDKNGTIYAIECNPRATSGVHLFQPQDNLAQAFFNETKEIIHPSTDSFKKLGIGMLLYGWKDQPYENYSFCNFLQTMAKTEDIIYHPSDKKPFFAIPYVYGIYWTLGNKLNKSLSAAFTYDTEWNNE